MEKELQPSCFLKTGTIEKDKFLIEKYTSKFLQPIVNISLHKLDESNSCSLQSGQPESGGGLRVLQTRPVAETSPPTNRLKLGPPHFSGNIGQSTNQQFLTKKEHPGHFQVE